MKTQCPQCKQIMSMSIEQGPLDNWRFDNIKAKWVNHKISKRKITCSFCGYKFQDEIKPSKGLKQVQDEEKQRLKDEAIARRRDGI